MNITAFEFDREAWGIIDMENQVRATRLTNDALREPLHARRGKNRLGFYGQFTTHCIDKGEFRHKKDALSDTT
jgi:hypothetical protein